MAYKKYDEQQRRQIANDYLCSGDTARVVGKRWRISSPTTLSYVREFGHSVRLRSSYPRENRMYHFNEHFFAKWSPDMAYVLGFIFADGSIRNNRGHYILIITQKEPIILEKIALVMNYPGPLYHIIPRGMYTLQISSKLIIMDLAKYGLDHGKKSHIMRAPSVVKFPNDFVRGYFDGDGSGGWYKSGGYIQPNLSFTSGSHAFLEDVQKMLPIKMAIYLHSEKTFRLMTTKRHVFLTVRDWMYSGESSLHIARKKKKLFKEE